MTLGDEHVLLRQRVDGGIIFGNFHFGGICEGGALEFRYLCIDLIYLKIKNNKKTNKIQ